MTDPDVALDIFEPNWRHFDPSEIADLRARMRRVLDAHDAGKALLQVQVVLPTHSQCEEAYKAERATALEQFIYENEPAGLADKDWRFMLAEVLSDAINEDRFSRRDGKVP